MPITHEQCRMVRAGLHWSQVELSRRSGVVPSTIAAFEKGLRTPYPRTVRTLGALLIGGVECVHGGADLSEDRDDE